MWLQPMIDHLMFVAPDLEDGVALLQEMLGVRAAAGGKHPGVGTHNALLSLGNGVYLEVLAPDPDQGDASGSLRSGMQFAPSRIATWAAKAPDIEARVASALSSGHNIGSVSAASRRLPDGSLLEWSFTFPPPAAGDGVAPFLIRWGLGFHPSKTTPPGCELLTLRGEHPEPDRLQALLSAMAVELPVTEGPAPALIATIRCPKGIVELH